MKTRLTFLQTIPFALALAGWMPLSAQTQNAGELKPPAQTNRDDQVFYFPGGKPSDFLAAVEKHYKADWLSIASIPSEMEFVRVPKLRIPSGPIAILPQIMPQIGVPVAKDELLRQTMEVQQRENPAAGKLWSLVLLYNRLSEHDPQLGTLVVQAAPDHPEKPYAVMLVPNKSAGDAAAQNKIRVFPLRSVPEADWTKLRNEIARTDGGQIFTWENPSGSFESSAHGELSVHRDTALLVAKGSESFVEMADSIVTAFQANSAETKAAQEKK